MIKLGQLTKSDQSVHLITKSDQFQNLSILIGSWVETILIGSHRVMGPASLRMGPASLVPSYDWFILGPEVKSVTCVSIPRVSSLGPSIKYNMIGLQFWARIWLVTWGWAQHVDLGPKHVVSFGPEYNWLPEIRPNLVVFLGLKRDVNAMAKSTAIMEMRRHDPTNPHWAQYV